MLFNLHFTIQSFKIKVSQDGKETYRNNITVYRKKLLEYLRNGKYTLKTQNLCKPRNLLHAKNQEIKRYSELKKLIPSFEKAKRFLPEEKKRSEFFFENYYEALKYCNRTFSERLKIKLKLEKVFDIFYSTNIPPIIKSKRNVIVVIENENSKKTKEKRITCPQCLKEEIFNELKQKIASRFKDMIVLIRKKLLRGLNNKKELIFDERPKPAFLIMDDLIAPFPEMEPDPVPVFSFTEDKPQERRKCKTESEQNEASKKNCHTSDPQGIFYQWSDEALLKAEEIEPSPDEEQSKPAKKPMYPCTTPLSPEDHSESQQDVDFLCQELNNRDSDSKINYNKNGLEVITGSQPNRDRNGHNKGRCNNLTYENPNKSLINNNHDLLNPVSSTVSNVVEDFSLSVIDLSNPSVTIIPLLKPKEKGKRNIIIKLKNVPDCIDVIKIKSIMSSIRSACETKKYSKYFLKNRSKTTSYKSQTDSAKTNRRQIQSINYRMTCPNKISKSNPQFLFQTPYLPESNNYNDRNPTRKSWSDRMRNNNKLRSSQKNHCFYDD